MMLYELCKPHKVALEYAFCMLPVRAPVRARARPCAHVRAQNLLYILRTRLRTTNVVRARARALDDNALGQGLSRGIESSRTGALPLHGFTSAGLQSQGPPKQRRTLPFSLFPHRRRVLTLRV